MLGKFIRKKSEITTKQNRIRRRLNGLSDDFFAAAVLLSAAVFLSFLFFYLYSALMSRSYFQIKEISVRGLRELTEKDILTSANIKPAQNLLAVNTDAVIRRICANQWVENIDVGKELPGKLILDVKERTPLALVKNADDFYLMDMKGFVFKRLGKSDEVDLPIITGITEKEQTKSPLVLSTLGLLKTMSRSEKYSYLGTIAEINVDEVFGLSVIFDKGLFLRLGKEHFESKLEKLKTVLADLENRGMKNGCLYVDISDDSKVTIKRKNIPEKVKTDNKGNRYLI